HQGGGTVRTKGGEDAPALAVKPLGGDARAGLPPQFGIGNAVNALLPAGKFPGGERQHFPGDAAQELNAGDGAAQDHGSYSVSIPSPHRCGPVSVAGSVAVRRGLTPLTWAPRPAAPAPP